MHIPITIVGLNDEYRKRGWVETRKNTVGVCGRDETTERGLNGTPVCVL